MVSNIVFKAFKMADLPKGTKVIDTTLAMKKKSSGTLRGRVNVRGFKQIKGQYYNSVGISSPVTNAMTKPNDPHPYAYAKGDHACR